jgi:hypothetical protein
MGIVHLFPEREFQLTMTIGSSIRVPSARQAVDGTDRVLHVGAQVIAFFFRPG